MKQEIFGAMLLVLKKSVFSRLAPKITFGPWAIQDPVDPAPKSTMITLEKDPSSSTDHPTFVEFVPSRFLEHIEEKVEAQAEIRRLDW